MTGPGRRQEDRPLRSALVTVGEELLLGRTVDTNAAWLSDRLASLGAPVVRRFTVGDDEDAIREALDRAMGHADVVVTSGGLGPTSDDLTRDAVAARLERSLKVDPRILDRLAGRFRARGYEELPPANRRQAQVPEGATVLDNPVGTAPGLVLEDPNGRLIALLPGVPRELQALFPGVEKEIRRRHGDRLRPVCIRTLHTSGVPESVLAPQVESVMADVAGVEVAFLPDLEGVDIRLTVRDVDSAAAASVVDPHRIAGSGDVVKEVLTLLESRGWTLGLGESCTGGLVARRITDVPGASAVLRGGVVAYANQAKIRLLGVPEELLVAHGAVSESVARAMAVGAARAFDAHCGVGITGVAGPGGGSKEKPVGTVHLAASVGDRVVAERWLFPSDRESVRVRSAQAALLLLLRLARDTA
ncbi:MAG: CinA family nicotinamide mononucleotide deamidase-related protein [Gemmatimonadota bacterium]